MATVLEASPEEYDNFLEELILSAAAADQSAEPVYRVYFVCTECSTPWSYDTVTIGQAGLKAVNEGCPLCQHRDRIALTHHEVLIKEDEKPLPDINEFVRIGVF